MGKEYDLTEEVSRKFSRILGGPLMVTFAGATELKYGREVAGRFY